MARRGFTLIEMLVVMGIVALLMALLTSAVQATRTAASATECRNNLRQLILAVSNYESQYGMYPNAMTARIALLPYLEQQPLARRVSSLPAGDPGWAEIRRANIPIYHCPSDPAPDVLGDAGASNYATCFGSGLLVGGSDGAFGYWDDFLMPVGIINRPIRASDLKDGTSTTAGISEWLHSDGTLERLRAIWQTPSAFGPSQVHAFQTLCESMPIDPVGFGWQGSPFGHGVPWTNGWFGSGQYNHMLPPNRPSCLNNTHLSTGIYSAASMHAGGVHVAFMDGHVTFTSENIDRRAWQRLGSRNDKAAGL